MSIYRREIDTQCCNQWMNGIRTINGQYPDDNRDFDINAGSGITIQPASGGITIINTAQAQAFVAGDNIEITPSGSNLEISLKDDIVRTGSTALTGDVAITGDLQVNGDIVQQGSAYETHAEKIFTANDYITMRDGAVTALAPGDFSGFQVKKYDGTNDGRLVIDRDGTARVGDVGDEQPLMTRDESADMTDGNLIEWDATNNKAVDAGTNVSAINTAINGKVSGTGNIGSDTKPVKIVNGAAVAVTNELQTKLTLQTITPTLNGITGNVRVVRYGQIVQIIMDNVSISTPEGQFAITNIPNVTYGCAHNLIQWYTGTNGGMLLANAGNTGFTKYLSSGVTNYYGTITYITDA